jgi:hypothetical protein
VTRAADGTTKRKLPPTSPRNSVPYLVLAGSLAEAKQWAVAHGLPRTPSISRGWIYRGSAKSMDGISGVMVVELPGFVERKDESEIRSAVWGARAHLLGWLVQCEL